MASIWRRGPAGEPYRDRLLVLPRLLGGVGRGGGDVADLLDGLKLTGRFLEHHVFAPRGQALPEARTRYGERLARLERAAGAPPGGLAVTTDSNATG
jgi:DNA repair protein RecO (recombination protein O)